MDYGNINSQTGGLETGYNNYNATGEREDVYVSREPYQGTRDIQQIPVGRAFRGEVTDISSRQVTIRLENGNSVQARLAEPVSMHIGESLVFQVKSNENGMIEIRPVISGMQGQEATILKALEAASLPVNEKTVVLLQNLLKEQMPINKENLQNMYKLVLSNPGADTASLVQMKKHEIPLTKENIAQFEAYKNYEHRISSQVQKLSGELVQFLGEQVQEGAPAGKEMHAQLLHMAISSMDGDGILQAAREPEIFISYNDQMEPDGSTNLPKGQTDISAEVSMSHTEIENAQEHMFSSGALKQAREAQKPLQIMTEDAFPEGMTGKELSMDERKSLVSILGEMNFDEPYMQKLLDGELSIKQLLESVLKEVENGNTQMNTLVHNKAYAKLLQGAIEKPWFMTPEQLAEQKDMQQFYEKLSAHMKQLDAVFEAAGRPECAAAKTAGGMQDNIDFMNQINQMFNYVQIPLKMAGKTTHSDLYVFSKKKQLMQKDGKVSALLHLDMEILGSLDVYVEMDGMNINTQFKVAEEKLVGMFQEHMDFLDRRIREKGYQFTADVEAAHRQVDFVQDFLEQDHSGVPMQRFAFDVRA